MLCLVVATFLASLGPSVLSAPASASRATELRGRIVIRGFAFHPPAMIVSPGEVVMVANRDGMTNGIPHSVTANDGSFDTGVFRGFASFRAPLIPGHYDYHCKVHPFMTGSIHVSSG